MILFHKLLTTTLLLVFTLTSSDSLADTSDQLSVQELAHKAKAAFDTRDEETFKVLLERIFQRIAGFPYSLPHVPLGMSDDDYIEKRCEFDRVTQNIFSTEFWDKYRYEVDLIAFAAVRDGKEQSVLTRAMTNCRFADGELTKTSQFMLDGIAWAKKFQAADAGQALRMAQDKKALAEQNPKIIELDILATMVELHVQDKQKTGRPERSGEFSPQATLVDKADKGDLSAQLEMAHRLEIGDHSRQDNAMAYFWYKRALNNGGGEAAQSGLDRLLPRLTDIDTLSINIWTKNNHRPY